MMNEIKIKKCWLILLLLGFLFANSQSYQFRHYQVENGLSHNAVICSIQDYRGFLWFGTKDGLNRFDGYNFKVFRNQASNASSLGNNFIHCLVEDKQHTLWIGTENGLYQYNSATEGFLKLPFAEIGLVRDMQVDSLNNLWFISNFILYQYNIESKKVTPFLLENYGAFTSIAIINGKDIWASSMQGQLMQLNKQTMQFKAYSVFENTTAIKPNWIEKLCSTEKGDLLIATNRGVKIFSLSTNSYKNILTYNNDNTEIFARNFLQITANECWIATESGIFVYDFANDKFINLKKTYNDNYTISDNAIYTFCKDKEGGIWAGTYFGGVNYYPKQTISFQKYFPKQNEFSLVGNVVREIHEDKHGNFWIGTEDGGLSKWEKKTDRFINFIPTGKSDDISYTNIHGMLVDENDLWIGTFEHGLDILNVETGKLKVHYDMSNPALGLTSNFIYCIYKTSEGKILIGTTANIQEFDKTKAQFFNVLNMPSNNWYSCILKDKKGGLWAGTFGNGLHYIASENKGLQTFRYNDSINNSISSNRINALFQDNEGDIWVTTENGLCKYSPSTNSFKRYGTEHGFPINFILSILQDNNGLLWISTTKGLVCFNKKTEKVEVFFKESGLLNNQFNYCSAYKDAAGKLYFGSVKGLISFNPNERGKVNLSSKIYFTDLEINNQTVEIGAEHSPLKQSISSTSSLKLSYNQSTFSIGFSALSYTASEMINYEYKMEGLNASWIQLHNNRKIFFTQLAPGNYKLLVRLANSNNNTVTTLQITILPPWWSSWWAKLIYLLLFFVVLYFIINTYHQRIKEKNEKQIALMAFEKDRELYKSKMEFFTNITHEIKTPLTLIKAPLETLTRKLKEQPEDIQRNLILMQKNTDKLVDLANQILDVRHAEINEHNVHFQKENIGEILAEQLANFQILAEQKNICITVYEIPQNVFAYINADAFEKIVNNLLGNALKYAAKKIELIMFVVENEGFAIQIKNDGFLIPYELKEKIFEPFFRIKETETIQGSGIGLAYAKTLAELHKGQIELLPPKKEMNIFQIRFPLK